MCRPPGTTSTHYRVHLATWLLSDLLTQPSALNFSISHISLPFSAWYNHNIWTTRSLDSWSSWSSLYWSLFPPISPLLPWPGSFCQPCPAYCFLPLLWTLPDASGCTLLISAMKTFPSTIPWRVMSSFQTSGGKTLTLYTLWMPNPGGSNGKIQWLQQLWAFLLQPQLTRGKRYE